MKPEVISFFHDNTATISHLVIDLTTKSCAVIDPVLDYEAASGRTATTALEEVISIITKRGLKLEWILETHAHADHLSSAAVLKKRLGGKIGIGDHIVSVQETWKEIYNISDLATDGSQFDRLFRDGDTCKIGALDATVWWLPGHTRADIGYVMDGAAFVGDTLFMPDYGTARVDFPGGNAHDLFKSIHRLYTLPDDTELYLCHDYLPKSGRAKHAFMATVKEQRQGNIHIREGVSEQEFVSMREGRDKTLALPALLLPSIQVNIRAGHLPPAEQNGVSYLKIPLNKL